MHSVVDLLGINRSAARSSAAPWRSSAWCGRG
jgi:hypothetical protein